VTAGDTNTARERAAEKDETLIWAASTYLPSHERHEVRFALSRLQAGRVAAEERVADQDKQLRSANEQFHEAAEIIWLLRRALNDEELARLVDGASTLAALLAIAEMERAGIPVAEKET
jgi:hypothetical protein